MSLISILCILIALLPLLATIVISLAGHRIGEDCRRVGTWAIGLSFACSVLVFVEMVVWRQPIAVPLYQLMQSGSLTVDLGLYVDQLSVLLLLLVTGVSFVVHAYSSRYMIGDSRYARFFALMALFTFAMVTLVMSSNLLMIFMCWELMGICSYFLISHQSDRKAACSAATKAFLVNAVADVGLLFGLVLTFATFGTLDIQQILEAAPGFGEQTVNLLGGVADCGVWLGGERWNWPVRTVTLITLFLFAGCLGKSAQVPFHVWLPQAMEAPTPVSALIHAATMVNAGPFLLVRLSPLVMLSPTAMTVIAIVGGTTALFAGLVSLTQNDVKKTLAYSTICQIGFMIMTCGLGAFVAAIFHLLAHGLLKGYLFLSTGSQLDSSHAHNHHESSSDSVGPAWPLYAGTLFLACIAPILIFSGPYGHMWTVSQSPAASIAFSVIGLITVFLAAVYCVRGVNLLFRNSPWPNVKPQLFSPVHVLLVLVGTLAMVGSLLLLWRGFAAFLVPALNLPAVTPSDLSSSEPWRPLSQISLFATAMLAAVAGWAIACLLPTKFNPFHLVPMGVRKSLYILFLNRLYFDEIYDVFLVHPIRRIVVWLWKVVDVGVIDRVIVQFGRSCVAIAIWLWRTIDVRGIERSAERAGGGSFQWAHRLWTFVDVRRMVPPSDSNNATMNGDASVDNAYDSRNVSARPLQHQLQIQILWLIVAITFFYWLVLYP